MQFNWSLRKRIKSSLKLLIAGKSPVVRLPSKPKALLIGVPIHDNLGDHLLAETGSALLRKLFDDRPVIEITTEEYMLNRRQLARSLRSEDYAFIAGGGWLGDAWPADEMIARDMVELTSSICSTIVFPQTIHYKHQGELFETGLSFWKAMSNCHIFTREVASFRVATESLGVPQNKCSLLPDLGLLFPSPESLNQTRHGAIICLREDQEAMISAEQRKGLLLAVERRFKEMRSVSTLSNRVIPPRERKEFLKRKLSEFESAEFVLTDRLHGMIFAVLAGTPCVAINNSTGKVNGVYSKWLLDYPGVKVIEESSEIEDIIADFNSVFPDPPSLSAKRVELQAQLLNQCISRLKELTDD